MFEKRSDFFEFLIEFPSVLEAKIDQKSNNFMKAQICGNRCFTTVKPMFFRSEALQKVMILLIKMHARNEA